jgi:hypothetical protein
VRDAAASVSSGLGPELERHLASLADPGVKRLVVENSGRIGVHVDVHSGVLDDLIASGEWRVAHRHGDSLRSRVGTGLVQQLQASDR